MQNARRNIENFDMFCSYFLSNVIGKQTYNKKVLQVTISEIATVSDEAFVMLCLENSMERWEHEAREPTEKRLDAKYTASPAEASKYGGWTSEGMRRFNTLQREIVPEMRRKIANLEEEYKLRMRQLKQPTKRVKKAKLPANRADMPWSEYTHDADEEATGMADGDQQTHWMGNDDEDADDVENENYKSV
jgi:hypothetical protein